MARLTKKTVEALEPSSKPILMWDEQLLGFGVKVLPSAKRQYLVKYRVGGGRSGRQRWYLLGTHGRITCDQARDMAQQALAAVARGEDPQQVRCDLRAAPTVRDLWGRYQVEHLPKKKTSSAHHDTRLANLYLLPSLGNMKAEDVSRADVARLHHQISDSPYQANRLIALISKMFNLAELWGYRPDGTNPTRHIVKFAEKPRQRFLSRDEIQRVSLALNELRTEDDITIDMAAAIRLLLLTGARVGEILAAEWSWVNWNTKTIDLPDSKTGAKSIYLSDQALSVLHALDERNRTAPHKHVIRGRLKDAPLINLRKPWKRICDRAGISGVRIHDLRHTAASFGVASGLSLPLIGRLLGHTQMQTTQRYAHVDNDPALLAANAIGKALEGLVDERTARRNGDDAEAR